MFNKVLVANRGEIAVRVMRACEELNVATVAVYSDADRHAGHVTYADEAYNIGPARAADSYLDQEAIIDAATRADADAIHPGYGFLAENSSFAALVEQTDGLTWIGPPSEAMDQLGEKTSARKAMQSADVPIVPGTVDPVTKSSDVQEFAAEHGYPIAIKAEGGGGGRGMKIVRSEDEITDQLESARREGEAYFDNDSVYLERYLENPRHIEVQILADHHGNTLHLGERDCSLQRRHQKVIEEAPSPILSQSLREKIGAAARRGAAESDYTNAGTVEFLVEDDEYYFLEVNTRIQVEHTVTEEITGIDIVKWQLRVAAGEELAIDQDEITFDGHAMEFRINAENPANSFSPTPGTLTTYNPPGGIGVRIDAAVRQGDEISGDYDSMIGKLIVQASNREECLARGIRALREFDVEGVHTTIPFHRLMLTDETFRESNHTTKYLDGFDPGRLSQAVERWGPSPDQVSADSSRELVERTYTVEVNGKRFEVALEEEADPSVDTQSNESTGSSQSTPATAERNEESGGGLVGEGETVSAEMQGTILEVMVSPGDTVEAGDVVCVLEAMKMENDVVASQGGTVSDVLVTEGDSVDMGQPLIVLE